MRVIEAVLSQFTLNAATHLTHPVYQCNPTLNVPSALFLILIALAIKSNQLQRQTPHALRRVHVHAVSRCGGAPKSLQPPNGPKENARESWGRAGAGRGLGGVAGLAAVLG